MKVHIPEDQRISVSRRFFHGRSKVVVIEHVKRRKPANLEKPVARITDADKPKRPHVAVIEPSNPPQTTSSVIAYEIPPVEPVETYDYHQADIDKFHYLYEKANGTKPPGFMYWNEETYSYWRSTEHMKSSQMRKAIDGLLKRIDKNSDERARWW